ncbi:hypothetical protein BLNAU_21896 [Blattamonas nauphoetae]|uniref:Uncharacterized protein n=1 Tax=Blattamonas nauphoetae TaxID=2049346 RepID=A0ABQ9WQY6_9EUKA|nr:hypothetical protein BLNAU_23185 [Blattamonas nauphoetae]KAK2943168.1 hypothetical protein BLNAU_21896 [Blattamonas nauphoetae]
MGSLLIAGWELRMARFVGERGGGGFMVPPSFNVWLFGGSLPPPAYTPSTTSTAAQAECNHHRGQQDTASSIEQKIAIRRTAPPISAGINKPSALPSRRLFTRNVAEVQLAVSRHINQPSASLRRRGAFARQLRGLHPKHAICVKVVLKTYTFTISGQPEAGSARGGVSDQTTNAAQQSKGSGRRPGEHIGSART